ncbi:MAG: lipid IV(A) 3-deoxy-D-manno-octulosonic acid transferase [Thiogranum sp.]|nr:lipid IV(A) 3-deoxy-D-manno-octulosonic acid transferase [Thiogranum sp.]
MPLDSTQRSSVRRFYSLLLYLLLPWALLRLWWRGRDSHSGLRHLGERFGYLRSNGGVDVIWLHAVSVGEVYATAPLVQALQQRWPHRRLWMTTSTPTGRATIQRLFGSRVSCSYLPYDLPGSVGRFLSRVSPSLAIVLETELWPNLFAALQRRNIPLAIVNARLSADSLRGYARFPGLVGQTLQCVTHIAAQTPRDADRFSRLGASSQQLSVIGNLKFDALLPEDFTARRAALRQRFGSTRPLWIAASTHPGEEQKVLEAHRRILANLPEAVLLLAPRHPERCPALQRLCESERLPARCYSSMQALQPDDSVILVDVLGELRYLYAIATAAFIGGSLAGGGGHNPIEAVLAGAPVISGPQRNNFAEVYRLLEEQGAVTDVEHSDGLADAVFGLLADTAQRQHAVAAGRHVIEQQRGAVERTLALLEAELLSSRA